MTKIPQNFGRTFEPHDTAFNLKMPRSMRERINTAARAASPSIMSASAYCRAAIEEALQRDLRKA